MERRGLEYLKIGFEVEFGHNYSSKKIKADFLDAPWMRYSDRFKPENKERAKECYSLYYDNTIDPDFGDEDEFELVTPVWDLDIGKSNLKNTLDWVDVTGGSTNHTTSLHVNISLHGPEPYQLQFVDKKKLILFSEEEYWLRTFKRYRNKYCRPHVDYFRNRIKRAQVHVIEEILPILDPINTWNHDQVAIGFTRPEYVEFRIIGGKNYVRRWPEISRAIDTFSEAMLLSCTKQSDNRFRNRIKDLAKTIHFKLG